MCTGLPAISHKSSTKAAFKTLFLTRLEETAKLERGKKSLSAKRCVSYEHHATRSESLSLHQESQSPYCFNLDMTQSETA